MQAGSITNRTPDEGTQTVMPGDMQQLIENAITAGWAWSVFSQMSSAGPLAFGIEVSEEAAAKRVEDTMRRRRDAAFGGIAGAGTEKVCQRTTSGGFRWRQVPSATG
jgi:hypothetical protein